MVTPAQQAAAARFSALQAHPLLRNAALVSSTFHLDPVMVLAEPDRFRREVRLAAHNVVQSEARKAGKKSSS